MGKEVKIRRSPGEAKSQSKGCVIPMPTLSLYNPPWLEGSEVHGPRVGRAWVQTLRLPLSLIMTLGKFINLSELQIFQPQMMIIICTLYAP